MTDIIRLEWAKDANGYEIREMQNPPPQPRDTIGDWQKYQHLYICGKSKLPKTSEIPSILKWYVLEGLTHRVYEDLANKKETVEEALSFTRQYGFLDHVPMAGHNDESHQTQRRVSVASFFYLRSLVHEWLEILQKDISTLPPGILRGYSSVNLQAQIRISENGKKPELVICPPTLLSFIHLEVTQTVSGEGSMHACKNCGKIFTVGPGTGSYSNKETCSGKCRTALCRARKRSAA